MFNFQLTEKEKELFEKFSQDLSNAVNINLKRSVKSALLMNDCAFIGDGKESVIVTFADDMLEITSRDSGYSLILNSQELEMIIAFALQNGFKISGETNETDK